MSKRSFEELSVVATGVQSFEARFGKRKRYEDDGLPPISQWRCNLTGLSQEHNLYFVAYGRDIYVYVPLFPSQAIDRNPALIVPSQPSGPDLQGYIDQREPHTINNLVVQRLGNDEVVATVRDDGDVEAVLVRHVLQAIERRAEPGSAISGLADEVKPIFQSNVGISAWGLAIHTAGRILAVSSNSHEVRIFKFGLMREDEDSLDEEIDPAATSQVGNVPEEGQVRKMHPSASSGNQRRMDVTTTVLNGDANIPYISLCNTGDDAEARWLLTTDIGGYCRLMDLHAERPADVTVQQFRFGRSFPSSVEGFDRLNAGWAIMFLDTRSFLPESNFNAAVGLEEGQCLPGVKANNATWDLSDTVERVPENSEAFIHDRHRQREDARRSTPGVQSPQSAETAETDDASPTGVMTRDASVETLVETLVHELEEHAQSMGSESESEDHLSDSGVAENYPEYGDFDGGVALIDDEDMEDEGTEDSISFNSIYGGRRIFGNQPYLYHQGGLCEDLPCPILHASVKNVYLLQPSKKQYTAPMVGLANPLRQLIQSQIGFLNIFDRLNMNAYIPQIGALVLVSQKGRALVLSLTKLRKSATYPEEMQEQRPKRTCYAVRVERILPLANQEKERQRPFAPLHGIAASPLQGAGQKRWRLMMMYQDHSVLSYEFSRKQSRDSGVGIEGLVI